MTNPPGFNSAAASGAEPLDNSRAGAQARLSSAHRGEMPDDPSSDPTDKASINDPAYAQWRDGQPVGLRERLDADYARYRSETGNGFSDSFIEWRETPEGSTD
jgi:hypothetical protein